MNALAIMSGYFVPIVIVVALFVLLKVRPPSLPTFEDPTTEMRVALFLFALFVIIVTVFSVIFKSIGDVSNLPAGNKLRSLLVWSILLLPFITTLVVRRQGLDTCLIPKKGLFLHFAVSAAMGFVAVIVYLLMIGKLILLSSVALALVTAPSLFLLAPILLEEFVFRGFLLARLTARLGRHKGILLAAAMFGIAHYPRYLVSSQMSFLQVTQTIVLITAVSVGGGYGIYAIRCMFYGVFIHWCMDVVQTAIPPS